MEALQVTLQLFFYPYLPNGDLNHVATGIYIAIILMIVCAIVETYINYKKGLYDDK